VYTKDELDSLDESVNHNLREVVLFTMMVVFLGVVESRVTGVVVFFVFGGLWVFELTSTKSGARSSGWWFCSLLRL
jgi:hypothetical protein